MADNVFMAPDAQQQQLQQQQAYAQALMRQGMQGNDQTQVVGGVAVRNSPYAGLANMLGAYMGGKMNHDATQQLGNLNEQKRQKTAAILSQGFDAMKNGDQQGAAQIFASDPATQPYAQEIMKGQINQQAQQAKPFDLGDVAKYDPESVMKYKQTGNYGDLKLADKVAAPMTDYQRQQLDIDRQRLSLDDRKTKATEQGEDPAFTPEAIDNAAARYNIDGTLPPMGMGKAGARGRSAILNRAAELASGITPDEQRINQLGNKSNSLALNKLQAQQTMVGAFEKNFNSNADLALNLSKQVDRTGIPLANKWIQAGKRSIQGDPDLSTFDAAIKSTVNEYSKIVSGSMGNTAVAEGEIKKAEGLLSAAQTPEQVEKVIKFMKLETQNRMKGFDDEKAQLRSSMGGKGAKENTTQKRLKFNPATGELE